MWNTNSQSCGCCVVTFVVVVWCFCSHNCTSLVIFWQSSSSRYTWMSITRVMKHSWSIMDDTNQESRPYGSTFDTWVNLRKPLINSTTFLCRLHHSRIKASGYDLIYRFCGENAHWLATSTKWQQKYYSKTKSTFQLITFERILARSPRKPPYFEKDMQLVLRGLGDVATTLWGYLF